MLKLQLISIRKTHNIQFSCCCCCCCFAISPILPIRSSALLKYATTLSAIAGLLHCLLFIWFFVHVPRPYFSDRLLPGPLPLHLFYIFLFSCFSMNAPIDLIYFVLACKTNSEIDALNLFDTMFSFFSRTVLFYDSFCHFYGVRAFVFFSLSLSFLSFLFLHFMNVVARVKTMHCT